MEETTIKKKESIEKANTPVVSCLRNEKVTVRFIPKQTGNVTDPKHVLYGGMSENAVKYYTVPIVASTGSYKNVLTNSEKAFLEEYMGLEYNALSIYGKETFWDNFLVRLTKQDTYLDLSDPNDYIKYKVLLANTDAIAPSLEAYQNTPKATYKFMIISEDEVEAHESENMSATMKCYKEFGKIDSDFDKLRIIVETLDGRPIGAKTKIDTLRNKVNNFIQSDAKLFLKVIKDPYLDTKILIKKAVEAGIVAKRGDYYYMRDDNSPLCNSNEDPTFTVAAAYLNLPKNQELKFSIEAKLKS